MNVSEENKKYDIALSALKKVTDPEIGLNIVDLGLIYKLDIDNSNSKIYLKMTLTTPFCPMGEAITGAAKRVLEDQFQNMEVEIDLTFDPQWNRELISEEGLNFLS